MYSFPAKEIATVDYFAATKFQENKRRMVGLTVFMALLVVGILLLNKGQFFFEPGTRFQSGSLISRFWGAQAGMVSALLLVILAGITVICFTVLLLRVEPFFSRYYNWIARYWDKRIQAGLVTAGSKKPGELAALFYYSGFKPRRKTNAVDFGEDEFVFEKGGQKFRSSYQAIKKVFLDGNLYVLRVRVSGGPSDCVVCLDGADKEERCTFLEFMEVRVPKGILRFDRKMTKAEKDAAVMNIKNHDPWDSIFENDDWR